MIKQLNFKENLHKYLLEHGANIEYDVFLYGYGAFVNYLFYVIITFSIALFTDNVLEVLSFWFFFIPLRRYIGGYHFSSKVLCLVFSVFFSIFLPYIAVSIGQINFSIRIVTLLLMIIITISIKAVDHPNKRISVKEKLVYTRKSLMIEIGYSLLIIVVYNEYTFKIMNIIYITMAFCVLGILIARLEIMRYNKLKE